MKVSLSWLRDYVPITLDPKALADALTMAGLEVDAMWDRYAYLEQVLVGRIHEVSPHPNAAKLICCRVDLGSRMVSVVCGAPNVKTGLLMPLAVPGAVLPNGLEIKESVIRGQASEGMLCSAFELGLGEDASGIMLLPEGACVGSSLTQALSLSDVVFEIGLTPNRPDCASIIGIAREVAAIQQVPITYPAIPVQDRDGRITDFTSVTIDAPSLCHRYAAKLIENITICDSPAWLKDRLLSVGQRPINNIVDVTNFVMLETGQPLHAFDFDQLAGQRIVVRTAREGEPFTTLDKKERTLSEDMLLICDAQKAIGIAGVMGGENSEIETTTTRVLIESAYFKPQTVRKTSKKLGLSTDASYRFERGVDPQSTVNVLVRAAELMVQVSGGRGVSGIIDMHPTPTPSRRIPLTVSATNRLLGTAVSREDIIRLLSGVEITLDAVPPSDDPDLMIFSPPSFRVDIDRPQDLMEEVARLYGYEKIPTTLPVHASVEALRADFSIRNLRETCREKMIGFGFSEAINYSFIHPNSCDRLLLTAEDRRRQGVCLLNPLTEDQGVMRTSLIPGLLETMRRNLSKQVKTIRMFEVGKVYLEQKKDVLPEEIEILSGFWTGDRSAPTWSDKPAPCDFYDLKGAVESLLVSLGLARVRFTKQGSVETPYLRPGYIAYIYIDQALIGVMGELHPKVVGTFGLKQTAFLFELYLGSILDVMPRQQKVAMVSKFPYVARDVTMIIDKKIESALLIDKVTSMDFALVEKIQLFDVFEGAPVAEGKKSVSFRIIYRSAVQTLEDEAVNRMHTAICEHLVKEFNADLP